MEYRSLGSTGLEVSVLGLGCVHLGWPHQGWTRADMVRLLEYAADSGVTFYDTADVYAGGESERLLGKVFGGERRPVVIATKVGMTPRMPAGLLTSARPLVQAATRHAPWLSRALTRSGRALTGRNFSPEYLRRAVERSLRRLRRGRVDLLQLHSPPAATMQRDDAFDTLERLRTEGMIRFYGVSFGNWREPIPLPLHAGTSTLQIPINIVDEPAVHDVLIRAGSQGLGIIGNQPFKKGELLRVRTAFRGGFPGRDGTPSLAQAVLRAVTRLSSVAVVLTGTTSIAHLRENLAAIDTPPLTPDEVERLRTALAVARAPR